MAHMDVAAVVPELDEALYRLEVLGQFADGAASSAENQSLSSSPDHALRWSHDEASTLLGTASIDTTPTLDRRSASPSAASYSTGFTSRSSTENHRLKIPLSHGLPSPSSRSSHSGTDYERFLVLARQASRAAVTSTPQSFPARPLLSTASSDGTPSSIKRRFSHLSRSIKFKLKPRCTLCPGGSVQGGTLRMLDCGHGYCNACLRVLTRHPVRGLRPAPTLCCGRAAPPHILKEVLTAEERSDVVDRLIYLNNTLDRVSCPSCAHISAHDTVATTEPSCQDECGWCEARFCRKCMKELGPVDHHCPADWAFEVIRQVDKSKNWIRCCSCSRVLQHPPRQSYSRCHCKTRWCCACRSSWESRVDCPCLRLDDDEPQNTLSGASPVVEQACREPRARGRSILSTVLDGLAAEARGPLSEELKHVRRRRLEEQRTLGAFEQKQRWLMWTRHGQQKIEMLDAHEALERGMKDRHVRATLELEERHFSAEMELREALAQERKSCLIRLRHMEDYCASADSKGAYPARVVTDRDLRELGQQYDRRDDMDRLHEARIKVMRDKQERQSEALELSQREECRDLLYKMRSEVEELEAASARDEEQFHRVFKKRREQLTERWAKEEEGIWAKLELDTTTGTGRLPSRPRRSQLKDSTMVDDPAHAAFLHAKPLTRAVSAPIPGSQIEMGWPALLTLSSALN